MDNNEIIEILKKQQKAIFLLHETVKEICEDELHNCRYKNQYDIWLKEVKKNLKQAKNIIDKSVKKPVITRDIVIFHICAALNSISDAWTFQSKPITLEDIMIDLEKEVKEYPEVLETLVNITVRHPFHWLNVLQEVEPAFSDITIPEDKLGNAAYVSNAFKEKWEEIKKERQYNYST